jgi:hypothetical protein
MDLGTFESMIEAGLLLVVLALLEAVRRNRTSAADGRRP